MVDGQSTDIFYTDKKILERESQGKRNNSYPHAHAW